MPIYTVSYDFVMTLYMTCMCYTNTQVLCVNGALKMGAGKIGAQCAHAACAYTAHVLIALGYWIPRQDPHVTPPM